MHVTTRLDLDVVAVQTAEQVSLMVGLTAPTIGVESGRRPRTLVVVLDRSGSMGGERLDGAKRALADLLDRLDPADRFGLVSFDSQVRIEVPAGPLADKAAVQQRIASIQPGGSTDLSAGYLRGLQEARRAADGTGGTVLLISDGHANAGVTDPATLRSVAAAAAAERIATTTVGFGLGYDETLLGAIASGGNGRELFAERADDAVAVIAAELDGLLAQTAQAAALLISMAPVCRKLLVINEVSTTTTADGVQIELGSFYSGETRRLVITFDVPGLTTLGPTEIAALQFTWVELPGLTQHSVTTPVSVTVLPADLAAGRIADPVVRTELAFLLTQQAKRLAAEQMTRGDSGGALNNLQYAQSTLRQAMRAAPAAMRGDLAEDIQAIEQMAHEVAHGDLSRAAKFTSADTARKSRQRGSR